MPRIIREIVFQDDPDFRGVFLNMLALIQDAYDRGVISWARRCERINMMGEHDGDGLYETRSTRREQLRNRPDMLPEFEVTI